MKKFKVVIPEKRIEIVDCLWEVEAESIEKVQEMIDDFEFIDNATWIEDVESKWGYDVEDYEWERVEIKEAKDD